MVKRFCDKCGKEILVAGADSQAKRELEIIVHTPGTPITDKIELCSDCEQELLNWVEKGKK